MRDGNADDFFRRNFVRERRMRRGRLDEDVISATKLERSRLRINAPGQHLRLAKDLKPVLQMPSAGPPLAVNSLSDCMIGLKRAIAPVRK